MTMNYTRYNLRLERVEVRESVTDYQIQDVDEAARFCTEVMGLRDAAEEYFMMATLNCKGRITGFFEVSHGDLSNCIVHPREVFKRAITANASAIMLAHNHPSGVAEPSEWDDAVTEKMKIAGEVLGIRVVDHMIIGYDEHYSYHQQGRM